MRCWELWGTGYDTLALTERDAERLAAILGFPPRTQPVNEPAPEIPGSDSGSGFSTSPAADVQWGGMAESALMESGNIVGSAFVSAVATLVHEKLLLSVPTFARGSGKACVERLVAHGFVDLAISRGVQLGSTASGPGLAPMQQLLADALRMHEAEEYRDALEHRFAAARKRVPRPPDDGPGEIDPPREPPWPTATVEADPNFNRTALGNELDELLDVTAGAYAAAGLTTDDVGNYATLIDDALRAIEPGRYEVTGTLEQTPADNGTGRETLTDTIGLAGADVPLPADGRIQLPENATIGPTANLEVVEGAAVPPELDLGSGLDRGVVVLVIRLFGEAQRPGEEQVGEGFDLGVEVARGGVVVAPG